MDCGVRIQLLDQREQFGLISGFRQIVLLRKKPALLGRLALGADIDLARRVGPDQHNSKAGGHGERARLVGDARERDLRDGLAVEDERAQGEGIRFQARLLYARFINLGDRLVASAGAVPGPRRRCSALRLECLQRRPGAAADLQAFLQAFPNLGLFSPSFPKDSFGGFMEFQWVTIESKPKSPLPNFCLLPRLERSRSRAARPVWIVEGT